MYVDHMQSNQHEQDKPGQVLNEAGGYSFAVDQWARLRRWLILGGEGGTYYASERKLTRENAATVLACLAADPERTAETIAAVSESGRAPKQSPAIFATALCSTSPAMLARLPRVCRTGSHLLEYVATVDQLRGWGRGLRRAVARWYTEQPPERLAYQIAKYRNRNKWTHRDVLRVCHAHNEARNPILSWAAGKPKGELPPLLVAMSAAETATGADLAALIREHKLTHEMIPSERLGEPATWDALLDHMPTGALVRNLARMTANGLLAPMSDAERRVLAHLADAERIMSSKLHPVAVLSALLTYKQGHGERGKLTWTPCPRVIDALDAAFYASFGNVDPIGKNVLLALDVSGSMSMGTIAGIPGLTPRIASAAMAMVTAARESQWCAVGFAGALVPLDITPRQRLDDVIRVVSSLPFGPTDCALPMLYAAGNGLPIDAFVVYTDSETWCGSVHPHKALAAYRAKSGRNATLAVVGMTSNGFTIADPADPRQLDVVGFDTATPNLLADHARNG